MAYSFFRDNYILPKDITNYILLFLLPSDDDVTIFKMFCFEQVMIDINFKSKLYDRIMNEERWMKKALYSTFSRYYFNIKDLEYPNICYKGVYLTPLQYKLLKMDPTFFL